MLLSTLASKFFGYRGELKIPNAVSTGFLGNGLYSSAIVVRMNTLDHIRRAQRSIRFADGPFAVEPFRLDHGHLDGHQPRAFRGQLAGKNAHSAFLLHPLVVLVDPVLDFVAHVPGCLIPNECPNVGAPIVELARNGRTPSDLAEEFEPTEATIRNWLKQADRDDGKSAEGLSTDERKELRRLRKKLRELKQKRDILANRCPSGTAWFARETEDVPS